MTPDLDRALRVMAVRDWKFGPRRGVAGHKPQPNENRVCIAVGPDGRICGRSIARSQRGHVRHNPRAYGR